MLTLAEVRKGLDNMQWTSRLLTDTNHRRAVRDTLDAAIAEIKMLRDERDGPAPVEVKPVCICDHDERAGTRYPVKTCPVHFKAQGGPKA